MSDRGLFQRLLDMRDYHLKPDTACLVKDDDIVKLLEETMEAYRTLLRRQMPEGEGEGLVKARQDTIEEHVKKILSEHPEWNVETRKSEVSLALHDEGRKFLVDLVMVALASINPESALRIQVKDQADEIKRLKADLHARSMTYGNTFLFCQKLMSLGGVGRIMAENCTPGGHTLVACFVTQRVFFTEPGSGRIVGVTWSREPDSSGYRGWSCMPQLGGPWEVAALQRLGFALAQYWLDRDEFPKTKQVLLWCRLYEHRWTTGLVSEWQLEGGREP